MKPVFSIHAGEYLVVSDLEERYKGLQIWLPTRDTGIDLLVTNTAARTRSSMPCVSLQVKFSKDFLGNRGGKDTTGLINSKIKAGGWWKYNNKKIEKSPADLWVLVLYRFSHRDYDFVIIQPSELLARYKQLGSTSGTIQSYFWVTEDSCCWETRGLRKAEQEAIAEGSFQDDIRDFTPFLNNWKPMEKMIGL